MTDQTEQRFDIHFAGECTPGSDVALVRAALGKLFKADEATLDRLFSGERQLIKRGCDETTALTYQRAMKKGGAKPIIVRSSAATQAAMPTVDLALAAVGSDVLTPEERSVPVAAAVSIDHLSASPIGDRISPPIPETPPLPVPEFGLADVGVDLSADTPRGTDLAAPNTDSLSLAPPEYDLGDCAPPPPEAEARSLEHLQVADSGADLLTPDQRRHDSVTPPDTSHLRISDEGDKA